MTMTSEHMYVVRWGWFWDRGLEVVVEVNGKKAKGTRKAECGSSV